jgi:hypothetical protein
MIIIRTLNSEYSIAAEGDRFRVTKLAKLPHGNGRDYMALGESRLSGDIRVAVGVAAAFYGYKGSPDWHTSKVMEIREHVPPTYKPEPPSTGSAGVRPDTFEQREW